MNHQIKREGLAFRAVFFGARWVVVVMVASGLAAGAAVAAPQPVKSVQKDAKGVTVHLKSGVLRLDVCDDRTIHVSVGATEKVQKKEFVVNRQWTPVPFEWREGPARLVLRTARVGVEVDRATGALAFVDAAGKTLLRERADAARTFAEVTPAAANQPTLYRVEQTFLAPDDERLYGMAEAQDGVWNWRGMPIELRQVNTQAAFPVLVSSRGYGLLWDNASLTDFNPVDQQIALTIEGAVAPVAFGPTGTEQLPPAVPARGRGPAAPTIRTGAYTTGEAGEYVFFAKDGDRRDELGIAVDGKYIARLQNQWVPYTLTGRVALPAHTTVSVRLTGGGRDAKLFARPLGSTTTFRSSFAEGIDYYFFGGPELDDVVSAYRHATGTAPLWPQWAYGFWQCRERYSSQQQIIDTVAEFRRRQIPLDLIVQDWQYWGSHGWGAYEWDTAKYPDPAKMTAALHEMNTRFMISVWSNPKGKVGADMKARGYVLPGTDWIDQFNPAARELRWKYMNDAFYSAGTDAWWQDATEPADDGNPMAGREIFSGSGDLHRNSYPLFASQTVYDGQRAASPDKRVVTLTRSAFPGQQRYATALWSGDINGNWDALRRQIPAGLNVSVAGLPYWTTDAGGFFRPHDQYDSEDYADLLNRWFQFSTFSPVQRVHGYQSETEFWKYPRAEQMLIAYDRLRHRLLPYVYSTAWRVTHDHYTMMRPLVMDFRADATAADIGDEYMFGPAFLVSPVTQPKATSREVYLPAAGWTNFWTGETAASGKHAVATPPDQIPLFIRAGSIVPLGPELQYAGEKPADPIELRVYRGADGSFMLYEDEGDSYRYEQGAFATIPLRWNEARKTLTIGARTGEFPGMLRERTFRVVWVRPGKGTGALAEKDADVVAHYAGKAVEVRAP
ncbi:MAG: glycoside hydrolase family 31 protein [bacterium]